MTIRPLLLTLLAASLLARASAQPAEPAPANPPPAETYAPDPDESRAPDPDDGFEMPDTGDSPALIIGEDATPTLSRDHDTLSVDFPDEEIRNILRNVADLFELNLVIPDTLQGNTSIKLRDVSWRQIFEVVLSPVGFTFVEEGNIIKIVSQESLTLEPVTTDVFIVNYADANQLVASIAPLIDPAAGGKIVVDKRSNALVITERPSRLTRVRPIIEQLDKATDQVMIESKFVEVTDRNLRDLGVNWASLNQFAVGLQPTDTVLRGGHLVPRNNNGTLIPQVEEASTSFGAVFSGEQFNVLLSALQSKNDTRLVSNPTVVTLNNTEAQILIGQKHPVARPQYNQETGQIYYDIDTQDIGVQLLVTPQVNAQGFIRLKVRPIVSSLAGTATIPGGAEYPIIATREAQTEVSLKDGYTMGIGGLIENQTTTGQSRIPVLGSIPGLGRLFRSDTNSHDKRNLVIFITAKTVSAEGAPIEEIFDSRAIRDMNLRREDLPGYRDGTDPFELLPETPRAGS